MNFRITHLTKTKAPVAGLPLLSIKNKILGEKYELSLVFVGDARSKALNKIYRGKDKPTNILSFELSKNSGEIFINPLLCKKQAEGFGRTYKNFLAFLFIHGCQHLKGMEHGSTMEKAEERVRKIFKI